LIRKPTLEVRADDLFYPGESLVVGDFYGKCQSAGLCLRAAGAAVGKVDQARGRRPLGADLVPEVIARAVGVAVGPGRPNAISTWLLPRIDGPWGA
jgi:hypothetical protein